MMADDNVGNGNSCVDNGQWQTMVWSAADHMGNNYGWVKGRQWCGRHDNNGWVDDGRWCGPHDSKDMNVGVNSGRNLYFFILARARITLPLHFLPFVQAGDIWSIFG